MCQLWNWHIERALGARRAIVVEWWGECRFLFTEYKLILSSFSLMTFTRSAEDLAARRARVNQLVASGRVENDRVRTARRNAQKRFNELQNKADIALAGLQASPSRRTGDNPITTPKARPETPVAATRVIPAGVKNDKLALAAEAVLKELLGG